MESRSQPTARDAQRALEAGDLSGAEQLATDILHRNDRDPAANLILGIVLMSTGRAPSAVAHLKATLSTFPNDYVALLRLPIALREAGEYAEALRYAEAAHKLWPRDPEIVSSLALCLLAERQIARAVPLFKTAIAMRPGMATLHHNLGVAYELIGEDVLAMEQFQKAISLSPKAEESVTSLVTLLLAHGNSVQALDVCRKALDSNPNWANFHLLYSRVLRDVLEKELAEEELRTALEINPAKVAAAGFWMHEEGRFEEASGYFRQALERDPEDLFALIGLVQGKKVTEEDRDLVKRLEALLDKPGIKPPSIVLVRYALGKAYDDLRDYETAIGHFDEANRINYQINVAARGFDPEKNRVQVDRFLTLFSKEFIEAHRGAGSPSDVPIFIVGMIRSGTTLTEQIVSSHPMVAAAGEQKFWMAESPRVLDVEARTLDLPLLNQLGETYLQILRQYSPDKPHITDKMPLNFFWIGLIHIAFPNAKIIHVRRSPIDTCLSIYVTALAKAPDFAYNKQNIVEGYREYERIMDHWRQVLPADRFLEVRYEELVSEPEPVIRRMIDFCGLPWDEACLRHDQNPRSVSTPSMWQVRQPMYRTSVDRWKRYEPWLGELLQLRD